MIVLMMSIFIITAPKASMAQKKTAIPHQVCATTDFKAFANKYASLTASQQASCFVSSFKYDNKKKIIVSGKDIQKNKNKLTQPFIGESAEISGGQNHYGYVIRTDEKK